MTRRRSSTLSKSFFLLFSGLIFLLLTILAWFFFQSRPVNPTATTNTPFTITRGQTLDSIASTLKEKNLIRSIPAFKIQVFRRGISRQLQAGSFILSSKMSLDQLITSLSKGGSNDRQVTFIEGWRREQFAQALVDALSPANPEYAFDPDQFLLLTRDLEGQLYPDTYAFALTTTTAQAVDRLHTHFVQQLAGLENKSGLSDQDALILASLLERETITDAEKPIVTGILLNRLNADWPLQVDATVQYLKATSRCRLLVCDWWANDLTRDDLQIPSPFNTYLHQGLPPAPIANPSLSSIKAAYSPRSTDYWFYLHDPSGQIRYAKTLEEHNANVAKYLGK